MQGKSPPPHPDLLIIRENIGRAIVKWARDNKFNNRYAAQQTGLTETDICFLNQDDTTNIRLDRLLNAWLKTGGSAELILKRKGK